MASTEQATSAVETGLRDGPVEAAPLAVPPSCGAETCFVGRTRAETHPTHGPLQRLEYELYDAMAERLLAAMGEDAVRRWGCGAVRLLHARGFVGVGEGSVLVQVATPHRAAGFDACRALIDRIKHELPVWKREHWAHGTTYAEGCCAGAGAHGDASAPASGGGAATERNSATETVAHRGPQKSDGVGDKWIC
jgi:molybdopterin synthase catalytic subunit